MSSPWQRALIVGASTGIGEELARQLTRMGCQVALVARRAEELARVAGEIDRAAGAALAHIYPHDVSDYTCVPALFQKIAEDLGGLDVVFYVAGVMLNIGPDEYNTEKDRQMFEVNTLGAIAWLNEAAQRFERARAGTIVGISSVAGDRGRKPSPAYGATKAALNTYLESLRNRLGPFGVSVVTIKPGPVATRMTAGMKLPLLIPAEKAATGILAAARQRKTTAYIPGAWRPIMWLVRHIPSPIFKKMNF